jgi:CRISPR-associated protein Cas1
MKRLGNVLYITTPEAYVALDGENLVVRKDESTVVRLPLHNLEEIVCFNYPGVSPALMGACAERNIGLCFLRPSGRFLARVSGPVRGNLLLRKRQYQVAQVGEVAVEIARAVVLGKIANCRTVIERARRDHALLVNAEALRAASEFLKESLRTAQQAGAVDAIRGIEGNAASRYFAVFGQLVLNQGDAFAFVNRSRRPPLDNMNALLSFLYALLAQNVASALEGVGLDPCVGFLHADRPGRPSLALDMMEELRPVFADRLALSLVNRKQIDAQGFVQKESGGVLMDDATRKEVLAAWQKRKQEEILHPYLKEKIPFGLIPHVQATLLARYLRGDLNAYPPFFWG